MDVTIRRRLMAVVATAVCVGLGLAGCSSENVEGAASADTRTDSGAVDEQADAVVALDRQVPASCAALTLAPGAVLDGVSLGECVSQALSSYGSGTMRMTGETYGDVDFTYDPTYSFHGDLSGPDGPLILTFVDGEMWVDSGDGPVKGDLQSEDPEEKMVGVAAALYRVYSDLEQTAELVRAQPVWRVEEARDQVSLPDGQIVESYRIVSDGPFTWNEMPVSEFILWFGDDWVPVGDQATINAFGQPMTHVQHFFDLGKPVTITPPA